MEELRFEDFVFAIPVTCSANSNDWEVTLRTLRNTLKSVINSTSPRYSICVATSDEGTLRSELGQSSIHFVPTKFRELSETFKPVMDKHRKRRAIAAFVRSHSKSPKYIMFLDADDLVQHDLVSSVLAGSTSTDYYADEGYLLDCSTGELQYKTHMYSRMGSSFVSRFSMDELPLHEDDLNNAFSAYRRHTDSLIVSRERGRAVNPIPFPSVVYVTRHGGSITDWKRGSKPSSKNRFLSRSRKKLERLLRGKTEGRSTPNELVTETKFSQEFGVDIMNLIDR